MFAQAYMGRKWIPQMLSLHAQGLLLLAEVLCPVAKRWKGLRPSSSAHVRRANMGHPSREEGIVPCSDRSAATNRTQVASTERSPGYQRARPNRPEIPPRNNVR